MYGKLTLTRCRTRCGVVNKPAKQTMTESTSHTINWHNDAETAKYCMSRHWEPYYDDAKMREESRPTEWAIEDLDQIYECLWGRQKTNMVLKSNEEAQKVLGFLGDFVNGINHPFHGAIWADKTTYGYVRRRMDKIIQLYPPGGNS
jgi:hypothetical protein